MSNSITFENYASPASGKYLLNDGTFATVSAPQIGTGTFGSGVVLPADQVGSGTLGGGVLIGANQIQAGNLGAAVKATSTIQVGSSATSNGSILTAAAGSFAISSIAFQTSTGAFLDNSGSFSFVSGGSVTGTVASATTAAACTGNAASADTAAACSGNAASADTALACSGNAASADTAAACTGNAATATTATAMSDFGSVATGAVLYCNDGGVLKFTTLASSVRYKENIVSLDGSIESDRMSLLRPVSYNYKTDPKKTYQTGLIAEEVNDVFPEYVIRKPDGEIESVNYNAFIPELISSFICLKKRLRDVEEVVVSVKHAKRQ